MKTHPLIRDLCFITLIWYLINKLHCFPELHPPTLATQPPPQSLHLPDILPTLPPCQSSNNVSPMTQNPNNANPMTQDPNDASPMTQDPPYASATSASQLRRIGHHYNHLTLPRKNSPARISAVGSSKRTLCTLPRLGRRKQGRSVVQSFQKIHDALEEGLANMIPEPNLWGSSDRLRYEVVYF